MKIYNTVSKTIEEFKPIVENELKIYVCGPTVYNLIHLGNARPIIFFDTLARYFKSIGYKIKFVQNFTDVDDKIINKSIEENIDALEVSKKYINEFYKDISKLNLLEGIIRPKVSENIDIILEMIEHLVEHEYAYVSEDGVYFDVLKFDNYGEISNQNIEDLQSGKRVDINEKKKNPLDFALWKSKKDGEIYWDSIYGQGRPGWHIECSALIKKYLGNKIDIHGGGHDLIFPHHENENAQSKCFCKTDKLANYWMHNGYVRINNEKMSKSLGNSILLRDLLNMYREDVIRLFILNTHYRKPINYSKDDILAIDKTYDNILKNIFKLENIEENSGLEFDDKIYKLEIEFINSMENDFNTSLAISTIVQRLKLMVKLYNLGNYDYIKLKSSYDKLVYELKEILGLKLITDNKILYEDILNEVIKNLDDEYTTYLNSEMQIKDILNSIIEIRNKARLNKRYDISDKIRNIMNKYNIEINDKK